MKNLNPFLDPCFPVFEDAVGRKTEPVSKNALIAAFPTIQPRFNEYDQLYAINALETIAANGLHDAIREELKEMYSYDNAAIAALRRHLERLQSRSVRYTCQYCSLETAEEMDHIVGQEEFPEFSVHPRNLIPACSKCNRCKGKFWRNNANEKNLLNLYLDVLPAVRYLQMDVFIDQHDEIDVIFRLAYDPTISPILWALIQRHFEKLHLLDRMRKEALTNFTEFQTRVRKEIESGQSIPQITHTTIEAGTDIRVSYGANYWKAVFEEALVQSPIFWERLYQD